MLLVSIYTESGTQKWGSGAIRTISEQLRKELPGLKGFSERSIRYMRQFYEVWCNHVHQRLLVDENECRRNLPANGWRKRFSGMIVRWEWLSIIHQSICQKNCVRFYLI